MNTSEKVVLVGEVHRSALDRWLLQGALVLMSLALVGWAWWLFG